jgi:hypothetical protein
LLFDVKNLLHHRFYLQGITAGMSSCTVRMKNCPAVINKLLVYQCIANNVIHLSDIADFDGQVFIMQNLVGDSQLQQNPNVYSL